jgi:hypothetical protein
MRTTTSAPTAPATLDVVIARSHLLPEGYSLRYAPTTIPPCPASSATRSGTPRRRSWSPAPTSVRDVRPPRAEANCRQVGVLVADDVAGTAWEAFRPSTARAAIAGLRTVGRWRDLSAAINERVRIDRRRPVSGDRSSASPEPLSGNAPARSCAGAAPRPAPRSGGGPATIVTTLGERRAPQPGAPLLTRNPRISGRACCFLVLPCMPCKCRSEAVRLPCRHPCTHPCAGVQRWACRDALQGSLPLRHVS